MRYFLRNCGDGDVRKRAYHHWRGVPDLRRFLGIDAVVVNSFDGQRLGKQALLRQTSTPHQSGHGDRPGPGCDLDSGAAGARLDRWPQILVKTGEWEAFARFPTNGTMCWTKNQIAMQCGASIVRRKMVFESQPLSGHYSGHFTVRNNKYAPLKYFFETVRLWKNDFAVSHLIVIHRLDCGNKASPERMWMSCCGNGISIPASFRARNSAK